ncbi:MAG TPA: hypothetical protein VN450_04480 [Candidatus Methylomirabilis sp.]|nr:hypothetical protein [Candidatus Methylomirabilis sp.]
MATKRVLFALAVGVLMGTFAGVALASEQGMETYGPADSSWSTGVGTSEPQTDAWELRESMETGGLPDRPGDSSDAMCCRGIEGPTIESGGVLFRPEVDSGP